MEMVRPSVAFARGTGRMCGDQVVWRNGPGAARGGRGTGRPPRLCSRFRCKCIMPNLLFFGPQTTTRVRQTCAMGTQACSCGRGSLRSTRNGRGAGGQNKFACISCCRCMGATPAAGGDYARIATSKVLNCFGEHCRLCISHDTIAPRGILPGKSMQY